MTTRLSPCALPPSSYLETRAQSYEGSRTLVHRRVVSVHVCLPFYEDTKRSAGSMQIYAGRSLRVSRERAGRDGDNPHRILGYRIHECPPLLVHGKSCMRALKVELDIYIYVRAHIVEIQIEEKYRPVVFLLVYIHTLDGDFIRIIDLVARKVYYKMRSLMDNSSIAFIIYY